MKLFLSGLLFTLIISCKKIDKNSINNESVYTETGDYQLLQSAIDSASDGDVINLENRTYILSHSLILTKSISFIGQENTIITRENQINYVLKSIAFVNSKQAILNDTKGLIAGDLMIFTVDLTVNGSTLPKVIQSINGDTVNFESNIGNLNGSYNTSFVPAGTKLYKNINLFKIPGFGYYMYYNIKPVFKNIIFDGNRENNKGSYYWAINTALLLLTAGQGYSTVENCEIRNSPNESVVGHNMHLLNCYLHDLNGSGYHTSAEKINSNEKDIHSEIYNNKFKNTNQISTLITGHSEGAITHSNSGGYYDATGNSFINVGESVLGDLYASVSDDDWGTNNINFTNNTINGAGKIVHSIYTGGKGTINSVKIEDNSIQNMPIVDYSAGLLFYPGINLQQ